MRLAFLNLLAHYRSLKVAESTQALEMMFAWRLLYSSFLVMTGDYDILPEKELQRSLLVKTQQLQL